MFFLFLSRFFKGTSTAGACSSLIHKYDSLFARLSYFYFLDSLSRLLLSSLRFAAPELFFNVQVLFLPSHTLINEFFLFPSFPAHRTFPASLYLAITTIPSKVPPSYPRGLFLRQSRTVTTIHPSLDASQLLAFCPSFLKPQAPSVLPATFFAHE